jgi:hypothetical protein
MSVTNPEKHTLRVDICIEISVLVVRLGLVKHSAYLARSEMRPEEVYMGFSHSG